MIQIRNICIFGIGGIGGFIGSRLLEAAKENQDPEVYFVARGSHKEAIERGGLILETENERVVTRPSLVTDDLSRIPEIDLCFLCVKSYDLESSCGQLKPRLHGRSIVIPILNGVDIYERMRKVIDVGYILPGCVYMNAFVKEPGTIKHLHNDMVVFGNDPRFPGTIGQDVFDFLKTTPGIRFQFKPDPYPVIWDKYMFVASYALVTAYARKTIRQVYESDELKKLVMDIMNEIVEIGIRKGYAFDKNMVAELTDRGGKLPPDAVTSYQRDLAQEKGRNEGDIFGMTIIRMAAELDVPVPVTAEISRKILSLYEQ